MLGEYYIETYTQLVKIYENKLFLLEERSFYRLNVFWGVYKSFPPAELFKLSVSLIVRPFICIVNDPTSSLVRRESHYCIQLDIFSRCAFFVLIGILFSIIPENLLSRKIFYPG